MWHSVAMKILAFAGALRKKSFNRALLEVAKNRAPKGVEVHIFDLKGVPLYDQDVEDVGDPESVTAFKKAVREADSLLIATPEYNGSISGVLKNAIDWLSREKGIFKDKPTYIMGATPGGFATARAQMYLMGILTALGAHVKTPCITVSFAGKKFDEKLELIDESIIEKLNSLF